MAQQAARRLREEHHRPLGGIDDQEVERQWLLKTPKQRLAIAPVLERVRDVEEAREVAFEADRDDTHTMGRVAEIMRVIDDEVRDLGFINDEIDKLIEPYQALLALVREAQAAWQALGGMQRSQKRSLNERSVARTDSLARLRQRQARARFEGERGPAFAAG